MKQTAVEWLISKIASKIDNEYWSNQQNITEYVDQAKAMEKEQSEKIYEFASWERFHNGHGQTFEEYWNKTFKSE